MKSIDFLRRVVLLVFLLSGPLLHAVPVTFQVNMSYLIEQGRFDPAADFVDIAGSFNGWGSNPLVPLADPNADSIYEVTLSGFVSGQEIQYKHRINGLWDGTEEFPGGGPNRVYTVQDNNNVILVWYNDEEPEDPNAPLVASFSVTNTTLFSKGLVDFESTSTGPVQQWEWTFEGGDPERWNDDLATVFYEEPGQYDVQLVVRGNGQADTLLLPDYITVEPRDWDNVHWWNGRVFYEIFVRSFYDSDGDGIGDFRGLTQQLDYLNDGDPSTTDDLGITGIWLMPIHPSPSYHGYDVVDYRSINPDYGSMTDFKDFLDAAHQRGIRVIIDYVMNHSSSQHPWFLQAAQGDPHFRDFYLWSDTLPGYQGPWGQDVWHARNDGYYYGVFWSGMPDLNYHNPAVQDSMLTIADFWLEEVGVDGFRLDAIKHLFENGDQQEHQPETLVFLETLYNRIKQANSEAFAVGEVWSSSHDILPYVTNDRLDYCFDFDLAGGLLSSAGFGTFEPVAFEMQKAYDIYPHLQYGVFAANHDQNRIMSTLGEDPERAKLVASMYLMLPGIPYMYYGEEIGMTGTKPDPNIRTPMQWTDGAQAGFTTGTPWIPIPATHSTYNVVTQSASETSILNRYRKLIQLRNREPALQSGHYEPIAPVFTSGVYAFLRERGEDRFIIVLNLQDQVVEDLQLFALSSSLPTGMFEATDLLLDSSLTVEIDPFRLIRFGDLAPYGFHVIRLDDLLSAEPAAPGRSELRLSAFPNPGTGLIHLQYFLPEAGPVQLAVFDATGRELEQLSREWQPGGFFTRSWNVATLPAGTYIVRLTSPAGMRSAQIIIQD